MESRRSQPDIHTMDRALQQVQAELRSLAVQLSERSTSPARQQHRGDNRGGFAQTRRGDRQTYVSLKDADFTVGSNGLHMAVRAIADLEITEAWWYPHYNFGVPIIGYSFIKLHEAINGQEPLNGRLLGQITGQAKTTGEYATGRLVRGVAYRFALSEQPRVAAGNVIAVDSTATNPGAAWPNGEVVIVWRWL